MTTIDYLQSFIEYNFALNRKVWESIDKITEEQFSQNVSYSHGSVKNLMLHLAVNDKKWLMALLEIDGARDFNKKPEEFADRAAVRQFYNSIEKDWLDYIKEVRDDDLKKSPKGMEGFSTFETILNIVNHGTDIRAQLLMFLANFGVSTFDQDFAVYLFNKKAPL